MTRQIHNPLFDCQRRRQPVPTLFIRVFLLAIATIALTLVKATDRTQGVVAQRETFGIPTSSQLFFEEGREKFEQEQRNLTRKQSQSTEELLQIDENVQNSEELREREDPRLHRLPDPSPETDS
jgi:hypothetical protein